MKPQGVILTPEILESVYELLKLTKPFKGWKLPPGDEVVFHVIRTESTDGDYFKDDHGRHNIRVSQAKHYTLHALVMTVAHEMCHMHDKTKAHHGWRFRQLADSVCRAHGFDRGQF